MSEGEEGRIRIEGQPGKCIPIAVGGHAIEVCCGTESKMPPIDTGIRFLTITGRVSIEEVLSEAKRESGRSLTVRVI